MLKQMIFTKEVINIYKELKSIKPGLRLIIEKIENTEDGYGILLYMSDVVSKLLKISATDWTEDEVYKQVKQEEGSHFMMMASAAVR